MTAALHSAVTGLTFPEENPVTPINRSHAYWVTSSVKGSRWAQKGSGRSFQAVRASFKQWCLSSAMQYKDGLQGGRQGSGGNPPEKHPAKIFSKAGWEHILRAEGRPEWLGSEQAMKEADKINTRWSHRPGKDIGDKDLTLYSKKKEAFFLACVKNTAGFVSSWEKSRRQNLLTS